MKNPKKQKNILKLNVFHEWSIFFALLDFTAILFQEAYIRRQWARLEGQLPL